MRVAVAVLIVSIPLILIFGGFGAILVGLLMSSWPWTIAGAVALGLGVFIIA